MPKKSMKVILPHKSRYEDTEGNQRREARSGHEGMACEVKVHDGRLRLDLQNDSEDPVAVAQSLAMRNEGARAFTSLHC